MILNVLKFLFCLIRVKMAASPAATRFEDLKDTTVPTCRTATQSSDDGVKSRSTRMFLVFFRPVLSLNQTEVMSSFGLTQRETDRQTTHSSMAATCSVVIVPLVLRASDTCP